jgi:hypothetical protein
MVEPCVRRLCGQADACRLEDQAFDRAHRLGQTRDVNIYKLTVEGTVEDREPRRSPADRAGILTLQDSKRGLAKAALSGDAVKNATALTLNDIMSTFGLDSADKRSVPATESRGRLRRGLGQDLGFVAIAHRALFKSEFGLTINADAGLSGIDFSELNLRSSRMLNSHRSKTLRSPVWVGGGGPLGPHVQHTVYRKAAD